MLTTTHADGVTTIAMDDGKANAMSAAMLAAVNGALDEAEAAGEAVLLVGREGTFSGGYDLKTFLKGPEALHEMLLAGGNLIHRMLGYPRPIVSACNGNAPAFATFLLLGSDYRVGARGTGRLGYPEVAINLTVPHWAVVVGRHRMNPAFVTRTMVSGELYDPETAMAAGILDELVEPHQVVDRARELAVAFAQLNPKAHRETKALLREDVLPRMRQVIDEEITLEFITQQVAAATGGKI